MPNGHIYKGENKGFHSNCTMAKVIIFALLTSALGYSQAAPLNTHGGADTHCPLTMKVLDALKGDSAGNVPLKLFRRNTDGTWEKISSGKTNIAGEVHDLITEHDFKPGVYRVEFDTKTYWTIQGHAPFHEVTDVVFEAHPDGHQHYTLALLLSPFSFTSTAVVGKAHD